MKAKQKSIRFMVGTMDGSIPAQCHNDAVADACGWEFDTTDFRGLSYDQVNAGHFAALDIAVSLYGDNADAWVENDPFIK